jgi:hypothetical protein
VYRINLDFNLGSTSRTEVLSFWFYFCQPDLGSSGAVLGGEDLIELEYSGYGVFKAEDQPISFYPASWGRDERYKFHMYTVNKDGTEALETWGTKNNSDGPPATPDGPASYFLMEYVPNKPGPSSWPSTWVDTRTDKEWNVGDGNWFQWEKKWKLHGDMDNAIVDITAFFQLGDYTHAIAKKGNQ